MLGLLDISNPTTDYSSKSNPLSFFFSLFTIFIVSVSLS